MRLLLSVKSQGEYMKMDFIAVYSCLLLSTSLGLSQADDLQYFSALVTNRDGSDRKLLNFSATPSLGTGRLVIIDLSNAWVTSSVAVYQLGRDFTIEKQGRTQFLLKFEMPYGMASSMMITYSYDECLVDLKMTETTTTLGKTTFTEWNIWKRKDADLGQEPVPFLFPVSGIYPYFDEKGRELLHYKGDELNKKHK